MLVVEVNDLRIVENNNVDGFLIGTKKISSEVYYQFTKEEVLAFIEKAHIKKKLVFLDATNIFHDEDFKDVKEIIDYLSAVDYVMYNDLMILNIVPKEKRMYYSTTYITNILDFDIVEEENEYVLVSPELSLEELKAFNNKKRSFLIGFGTWEIFHSRRNLLSNYFQYRGMEYSNSKYHVIEEFRKEMYPIVENNGTKIYLNGYYYLGQELEELNNNLLLKTFDLDYALVNKIVDAYKKALISQDYEELERMIKDLPLDTNKGLLFEQSILTKGVKERG